MSEKEREQLLRVLKGVERLNLRDRLSIGLTDGDLRVARAILRNPEAGDMSTSDGLGGDPKDDLEESRERR